MLVSHPHTYSSTISIGSLTIIKRHNPTRSPFLMPIWDAACAEELCNNDDDHLGWWCWHNCYFHQGSCFAYGRMTDKGGKHEDKGFSRGEWKLDFSRCRCIGRCYRRVTITNSWPNISTKETALSTGDRKQHKGNLISRQPPVTYRSLTLLCFSQWSLVDNAASPLVCVARRCSLSLIHQVYISAILPSISLLQLHHQFDI